MATIIIKNSTGSGATPSSLQQGELAINVVDGKLFYGSGSGNAVKQFTLSGSAAAAGGSNTQVQYNSAGTLAGNANLTYVASPSALTLTGSLNITGSSIFTGYLIASGNLGVNTNSPTVPLDVHGSSSSGNIVQIDNTKPSTDTRIMLLQSGSAAWFLGNEYDSGNNNFAIWDASNAPTIYKRFTMTAAGDVTATSFTGSLFGTASWARNALTASYLSGSVTSASYASTASYVLNTVSSSFATSASYALSASYTLSSSYASTASYVQNSQTASYVLNAVSASFATLAQTSNTASYVVTAQTASYVQNAQTASYVLNAISSSLASTASYVTTSQTASYVLQAVSASFATLSRTADTASYVVTAQTASYITTAQTASYVLNAVSSSFASTASFLLGSVTNASTASYVNTLNQNVIITGSAAIGASSLGPNENTLTLGARDAVNEGGQLGFNAPGGTYTSASFFDLYQNRLRLLRGTNAGSVNEVAWWSMNNLQMALPAYTGSGAFPGTAAGYLAVDTSGNVITTTGAGGSTTPGGSNTQIQYNNSNAFGGVPVLTYDGTTLKATGSFTGSLVGALTGTASYADRATSASRADTASFLNVGTYAITASWAQSASNAISASWAPTVATFPYTGNAVISGSLTVTGSTTITGSLNVTSVTSSFTGSLVGTLTGTSSWATSASQALTASYIVTAQTASYVLQAVSASFATLSQTANTASYVVTAQTASYVVTAQTASYVTGSVHNSTNPALSSSYASTASYVVTANTASYVLQAVSASFATLAQTSNTASYVVTAQTASYVLQAVSASFATSASRATSSSYALSASYAPSIATFPYTGNAVITGSLVVSGSGGVNASLDTIASQLKDLTGAVSIDWNNRFLYDSTGATTVDYSQGILYDLSVVDSIQWLNRAALDSGGNTSIDWENRILKTPNYNGLEFSSDTVMTSQVYYQQQTALNTIGKTLSDATLRWSGHAIGATVDVTVSAGKVVFLDTDGVWYPARQINSSSTKMLGVNIDGTNVLLEGDITMDTSMITSPGYGLPLYLAEGGTGVLSSVIPATEYIRVIGHCYLQNSTTAANWIVKFRPSNDWYKI